MQVPSVTQTGQRGESISRGKRQGPQGGMSGIQGRVYTIIPPTEPADQPSIQGIFLLSHLWARELFDYGASHSFIVALVVKELG